MAVRAVVFARLRDLERAQDKDVYCPGYSQASLNERMNCWVLLVAAISKFESNYKTGDSFREPDGDDSIGLLAMSPGQCPNAPRARDLANPVANLICGTNRMAMLIARVGWIDAAPGTPPERKEGHGAALYWSTLRPPYRRYDPTRQRYLNLGKKPLILEMTKGYKRHTNGPAPHARVREIREELRSFDRDSHDVNFEFHDDRDFYEPRELSE